MKAIIAIASLAAVLSGCATHNTNKFTVPMIDTKGVDMNAYWIDVADCNSYARSVDVGQQAANGAVALGLLGAIVGSMMGNHKDALQIGLIGAASGASEGYVRGKEKQEDIVKRCIAGRGYVVLG
jgi:Na+-transporting methylmalonyl-CoA/oxaloacetate decarboxylase beta subunit